MTKASSRPGSGIIALLALLGILVSQSESLALAISKQGASQGTAIRRIIRKAGWSLPGSPEALATAREWTTNLGASTVLKKQLRLSSEPLYTFEIFKVENGDIIIDSRTCVLREIYALETARKVFAYEAVLFEITLLDDGRRESIGRAYRLYYYDDDGDGIFETLYTSLPSQVVPSWAKPK
jgi:hypothetical protein